MTDREKLKLAHPEITDEQYQDFDSQFKQLCGVCETDIASTSDMINYILQLTQDMEHGRKTKNTASI